MTNREIINKLKDLGYEDTTETNYWTYPVYGGTMRQALQNDILDFTKKYDDKTITIGVENDKWSFNGITDDDNVKTKSTVWLNHNFNNEDTINSGAITNIEEEGDNLILDVKKINKSTNYIYRAQKTVTFNEYPEEDLD